MFKNRITACIFTKKPNTDKVFKEFEWFMEGIYTERTPDWVILRTDNKILQYSENSFLDWNRTIELWKMFASDFPQYDVEVKWELAAKEIVVDMYNVDTSICIIINFNC